MKDRDFDEYYFTNCCGRPYKKDEVWMAFFARIADNIVKKLNPKRVLDAGCAMGFLVEALRQRGVNAYGCDISSYAISKVPASVKAFCWQSKVSDELEEQYDLIICQEVFPHVQLKEAETAVGNFCRHANDVIFSCCPNYPPNPYHVNLQPNEHWVKTFARYDFHPDSTFNADFMTPWAIRFQRTTTNMDSFVKGSYWTKNLSPKRDLKKSITNFKNRKVKDFIWFLKHHTKKFLIHIGILKK